MPSHDDFFGVARFLVVEKTDDSYRVLLDSSGRTLAARGPFCAEPSSSIEYSTNCPSLKSSKLLSATQE
jgi:hypothetical protein